MVQYTPPENVTLKVGLTPSDASYYFRLLTWYRDGVELVDGGRITLSDFNTTITITDTSENDSGVYEAKYNGLLIHPYDRICEGVVIDLLSHYPLLKPAVFHIYTDPSGGLMARVLIIVVAHCWLALMIHIWEFVVAVSLKKNIH